MGVSAQGREGRRPPEAVVGMALFEATAAGAAVGTALLAIPILASGAFTDLAWSLFGLLFGAIFGAVTGVVVGLVLVVARSLTADLTRLRVIAAGTSTITATGATLLVFHDGTWDRNGILWLGSGLVAAGVIAAWRTPSILHRRQPAPVAE